jgi:hypothetical protein
MLALVNFISGKSPRRSEGTATFPPSLQFLSRQIDGAERVSAHSIRPIRAGERNAFSDFLCLFAAAVQTFRPDHFEQRHPASYSGLLKFIGRNFTRVAANDVPVVNLKGRRLKQNLGGFSSRFSPTVYGWYFTHILL